MFTELQREIKSFFENPINNAKLGQIHPSQTHISVRLMDFYYEKYCEANFPDIYRSWDFYFRKYKKANFDFYARGTEKVEITLESKEIIKSTWSQLNFFKWVIQHEMYFPEDPEMIKKVMVAQRLLVKFQKHNKISSRFSKKQTKPIQVRRRKAVRVGKKKKMVFFTCSEAETTESIVVMKMIE